MKNRKLFSILQEMENSKNDKQEIINKCIAFLNKK
jgi:hypothetical protein